MIDSTLDTMSVALVMISVTPVVVIEALIEVCRNEDCPELILERSLVTSELISEAVAGKEALAGVVRLLSTLVMLLSGKEGAEDVTLI